VRHAVSLLTLVGTAACASVGPVEHSVVAAPTPDSATVQGAPIAIAATATSPEDSLADLAALEALHDLKFGSLGKGAEHVSGVIPSPDTAGIEGPLAPAFPR